MLTAFAITFSVFNICQNDSSKYFSQLFTAVYM